ncbi:MAG: response regulator transcription factor [Balneolaceae bacterium]|nr:response regulator transcription factor [Balneolaceae bacterium]
MLLSRRESEILQRLAKGKSNRQISTELYISQKTIENHITRMGKKLKCGGRNGLRRWLKQQMNGL